MNTKSKRESSRQSYPLPTIRIVSTAGKWYSKHRSGLRHTLIFAVIYSLLLFAPITSPYARLPLFTLWCRGLPIPATDFGNTYSDAFHVTLFDNHFFCSEQEAQEAGYHL